MKHILAFIALLWAGCGFPAQAIDLEAIGEPLQFVLTPDHRDPDEGDWSRFTSKAPGTDATLLFRQKIRVVTAPGEKVDNPLAMRISLSGVYDFYWDGQLIGSSRAQGADANRHSRVMIPVSGLTPGDHLLEMRITALGLEAGNPLDLFMRKAALQSDFFGVHWSVVSTFFVATASFLVGCYLLLLLVTGGRSPALLSAAITCFSIFGLIMLQEAEFLFSYPYGWQGALNAMKQPLAILIYGLLAWTTFTRLKLDRRAFWMAAAAAILAICLVLLPEDGRDHVVLGLLQLLLVAAAALAAFRMRKAPGLFFWGHGVALLALAADPVGKHPYLIAITLLLATDLALDIRRRTKEAQQLALVSERLRADLIKRNIQPHFLMNSLTALMEWVETDPTEAVEFIDGLADEFRLLADFAERKTVTLGEELDLCSVHLTLMERRFEASVSIDTNNVDLNAEIPPGILHTLIENAFSHNNYTGQKVRFHLGAESLGTRTRYRLSCPIAARTSHARLGTGTGTQYVIARLEEFCDKDFSFQAREVGTDWETTLEIGQKGR